MTCRSAGRAGQLCAWLCADRTCRRRRPGPDGERRCPGPQREASRLCGLTHCSHSCSQPEDERGGGRRAPRQEAVPSVLSLATEKLASGASGGVVLDKAAWPINTAAAGRLGAPRRCKLPETGLGGAPERSRLNILLRPIIGTVAVTAASAPSTQPAAQGRWRQACPQFPPLASAGLSDWQTKPFVCSVSFSLLSEPSVLFGSDAG